jgi:hypothetical protein
MRIHTPLASRRRLLGIHCVASAANTHPWQTGDGCPTLASQRRLQRIRFVAPAENTHTLPSQRRLLRIRFVALAENRHTLASQRRLQRSLLFAKPSLTSDRDSLTAGSMKLVALYGQFQAVIAFCHDVGGKPSPC